jgi:nucleotide-binding universal stress UspA family protein
MRRIVVGYDGTETAARAAGEAAELAQATGAELHFVTVVDDERVRHGMTTTDVHERHRHEAIASTERLLSSPDHGLADKLTDITVVVEVVSGTPADRLVEYAKDVDADLILVGNRRVQGIERILGSVAIAVLRHAHCSVYVAHSA